MLKVYVIKRLRSRVNVKKIINKSIKYKRFMVVMF